MPPAACGDALRTGAERLRQQLVAADPLLELRRDRDHGEFVGAGRGGQLLQLLPYLIRSAEIW
ncbi:MAG: hypothetical protein U5R48_07715 [Gammaproteobacteria bacterium]|nr:hypothetical protein [Gammaproteobacteria bacterium]